MKTFSATLTKQLEMQSQAQMSRFTKIPGTNQQAVHGNITTANLLNRHNKCTTWRTKRYIRTQKSTNRNLVMSAAGGQDIL